MSILKKVVMYHQNSEVFNNLHPNHVILTNFFEAVSGVVSEGTSDTYAAMVITKFNKQISSEFPFVKYIHLHTNKVKIDKEINSVSVKLIGKFISKLINSLFSDLFKHLIRRQLDLGLLEDLKSLGVRM